MAGPDIDKQPFDQRHLLRLVGYNCRQVYLRVVPLFIERMAEYDLRQVDYTILTLVGANPGTNQTRLAKAINVSPPNLAPLLDKLEKRGLLARERNPADKRSQVLALTAKGADLCSEADKTVFELESKASSVLTDGERAELLRLLQKIFLG